MSRIGYYLLRGLIEMFRLAPFRVLYMFSDGMAFLLHRVVRYRGAVMRANLRRSFPEKSETERSELLEEAYRNLADISLETVKGFTASIPELERRCRYANLELVNAYLDRGQSVILASSHRNNWEWPCMTVPQQLRGAGITVYKPLSNRRVDRYYNRRRERTGLRMVAMEDTYGAMRKHRERPAAYFFVADQSPSSRKNAHWMPFLHQETAFLPGIDFLSRRFGYPVIYLNIDRVERGHYLVTFSEICADPGAVSERSITRAYAETVQHHIRRQPGTWLWSHKRWKVGREAEELAEV